MQIRPRYTYFGILPQITAIQRATMRGQCKRHVPKNTDAHHCVVYILTTPVVSSNGHTTSIEPPLGFRVHPCCSHVCYHCHYCLHEDIHSYGLSCFPCMLLIWTSSGRYSNDTQKRLLPPSNRESHRDIGRKNYMAAFTSRTGASRPCWSTVYIPLFVHIEGHVGSVTTRTPKLRVPVTTAPR